MTSVTSSSVFRKFQSTFPRGERRQDTVLLLIHLNFNPRSREGNDYLSRLDRCRIHISIHVPARGTTKDMQKIRDGFGYFNPRSREGNDYGDPWGIYSSTNFNPRSREGNDKICAITIEGKKHFNPRSREGNDPAICYLHHGRIISIHVPARGTTELRHQLAG